MIQTLNDKEGLGVYPDLRTHTIMFVILSKDGSAEGTEIKRYFVEQLSHLKKRHNRFPSKRDEPT